MTESLTAVQRRIVDHIRQCVEQRGYPPTMRELAVAVGLRSTATVRYQLQRLEAKGWLRRDPNRPRAIVLVDDSPTCPRCNGSGRLSGERS